MKTVGHSDGVLQDLPWETYTELYWPAAAMITNAEEMPRFMMFLLSGGSVNGETLLSEELIGEMFKPAEIPAIDEWWESSIGPRAEMVAYGLGWFAHQELGSLIVEHIGAGRSSAVVALMPEENLGVFIVTNASFSIGSGYPIESAKLVSAMKLAAFEYHLGLGPTDWIEVLDPR